LREFTLVHAESAATAYSSRPWLHSPREPGWTLAMLQQHDDSTINIVLVLLLLLNSDVLTLLDVCSLNDIVDFRLSSCIFVIDVSVKQVHEYW